MMLYLFDEIIAENGLYFTVCPIVTVDYCHVLGAHH